MRLSSDTKNLLMLAGGVAGAVAFMNMLNPKKSSSVGYAPNYSGVDPNTIMQLDPGGVDPNTIMQLDPGGVDPNTIMQMNPSGGGNNIMQVHPDNYHWSHPYWRWRRRDRGANGMMPSMQPQTPWWYGNPYQYGGYSPYADTTFASPYGGGYYSGWESPWGRYNPYDAELMEQPGDLASQAASYN